MVFVDQLSGLPNDDELEREIAAASGEAKAPEDGPKKPEIPARFRQTSSNWK
jgi:hypothetical protein